MGPLTLPGSGGNPILLARAFRQQYQDARVPGDFALDERPFLLCVARPEGILSRRLGAGRALIEPNSHGREGTAGTALNRGS
jgi:hypothetical protein